MVYYLELEAFSFLHTEDGKNYTVDRVVPRAGKFLLNGNTVEVGILDKNECADKYFGKNENIWNTWNEEMFLVLSLLSEYVLWPARGLNSYALDLQNIMWRSGVSVFELLSTSCDLEYSVLCFVNYLIFQEAMNRQGLQLLEKMKQEGFSSDRRQRGIYFAENLEGIIQLAEGKKRL